MREKRENTATQDYQFIQELILQITTINLLLSLSSGAMTVMPALPSLIGETTVEDIAINKQNEVKVEEYQPITDPKNVERFIRDYFTDLPILAEIAKCESHFRHYDSSGEVLRGRKNSYDRGVMQINILYHEKKAKELGFDINDLLGNVSYARYLYKKEGARPWMSSSTCWAKFNQSEIAQGRGERYDWETGGVEEKI